jgi:hypothetical protein
VESINYDLERGLPASPDTERTVLGCILLDQPLVEEVRKHLAPADFCADANQRIFRGMLALSDSKTPIDIRTLSDHLSRHKELEAVGGVAYLSSLTDGVPRRPSLIHYAAIIRDKALLRQAIHAASAIITRAAAQEETAQEILGSASASFTSLVSELPRPDSQGFFVDAARFCSTLPEDNQWLVDGVIPVGSNGIIAGEPKAGKSFTIADLALSLASGTPFLGFRVPKPVRVGLIAREDYPGLTSWRINALRHGRSWPRMDDFCDNLYVNTRQQSDELRIDNPSHRQEVIEALTSRSIQFAIFDVLNVLHSADENDNTEMRKVMAYFSEIQAKAKCAIGLIHHLGKAEGKWTRRLRGASAIHGWVEWLLGISEDAGTRTMEIELKASQAPAPVRYEIHVNKQDRVASLKVVEGVPVQINTKGYMR